MKESIERVFDVGENPALLVKNPRGSIEIVAGEPGQISVSAKFSQNGSDDVSIEQDPDGRVVVLIGKVDADGISRLFGLGADRSPRAQVRVIVPENTQVEAKSVSSALSVQGLGGAVTAKTVSGKVHAAGLSGETELGTISGKLFATQLSGPTELNSVSGSVKILDSDVPRLKAKSVSGKLVAETRLNEGPYIISTVSGSGKLIVPSDTSATVRTKSVSGNVSVDLPGYANRKKSRPPGTRKQVFDINGGGSEVLFKSVSGSLRIAGVEGTAEMLPGPSPALEDLQAEDAEPTLDRMDILDQLERGEISPDEAIEMLG